MPLGSYQVKQVITSIEEHLTLSPLYDDEIEFLVELCSQNDNTVRPRFSSRHKDHTVFIQYENNYTKHPINGWYCACMSRGRHVGCCVHVAVLLWHLGVPGTEIESNTHPLSASEICSETVDSSQFSDVDVAGDEQNSTDVES